ncbi:hypothetical protein QG516_03315 [Pedobacter gandavensis]|uniref:hypothetical protein n=1 Tax=Pedobacter gandavensis TaxID=2679963 RepID=UPI002478AD67|nr:hypothetical protein [Pedobacter gandavensis]WGQ10683.1 hypothetical protein QG516_03315 [Pedobacter gandavensis]
MCNFYIEYPESKNEMVDQLKAAIEVQTDGLFQGNTLAGEFSFSAKGFKLAGTYRITGDTIQVEITNKPWLLSCRKIEAEIRKYLAEAESTDTSAVRDQSVDFPSKSIDLGDSAKGSYLYPQDNALEREGDPGHKDQDLGINSDGTNPGTEYLPPLEDSSGR